MATTNYLPDRILLRNEMVNCTINWNSTDSEAHWNKNKADIDSYYSDTNVIYTFNEMGYRSVSKVIFEKIIEIEKNLF